MYTRILAPSVFIAFFLLSGPREPGSGSDSTGRSSPERTARAAVKATVDVCSLLTREEIAAVTGAKITATEPAVYGPSQVCNYTAQGQPLPVVSLLLTPNVQKFASSTAMAEWQRTRAKKGMSMGNLKFIIEPVEGLGVPAIRNEIEGAGNGHGCGSSEGEAAGGHNFEPRTLEGARGEGDGAVAVKGRRVPVRA